MLESENVCMYVHHHRTLALKIACSVSTGSVAWGEGHHQEVSDHMGDNNHLQDLPLAWRTVKACTQIAGLANKNAPINTGNAICLIPAGVTKLTLAFAVFLVFFSRRW